MSLINNFSKHLLRTILVIVTIFFFFSFTYAQKERIVNLKWSQTPIKTNYKGENIAYYSLENSILEEGTFDFYHKYNKLNPKSFSSLESYTYEDVSDLEKKIISKLNIDTPNQVNFKRKSVENRAQVKEAISLNPYFKINGVLKRVTSITLSETVVPIIQTFNTKMDFATNSVLKTGSGEWYKISLTKDGVYKIDYAFLESLGVNMSGLSTNSINIYGNGFGKLPKDNDVARPDDLIKNAIRIIGDEDGIFNNGDYITFYGKGPHRWEKLSTNGYKNIRNIYATESVYFININTNGTPKRIEDADLSIATETHTVTSFNEFQRHESDLKNLLEGGQRFYGEEFDVNLTQNFPFSFPNIVPNAPFIVESAIAYQKGGNNAAFKIKSAGTTIINQSLSTYNGEYLRVVSTTALGAYTTSQANHTFNCEFVRANPSDVLYLDYIEVNTRRYLKQTGNQMQYRDLESVGNTNIAKYIVSNYNSGYVTWEVTDRNNPKKVNGNLNGSNFEFKCAADSVREFISFNGNYLTPSAIGSIANQNLHGLSYADNLIVTHRDFVSQANRLADLHRAAGLTVHVTLLDDIYNEFSSGTQDPTAIKMFAKMFFDRANGDENLMPKYLTLFGDTSYDPLNRIENNNYKIPAFYAENSEDRIKNLLSDDYYGLLGDTEGFGSSDDLDIGVGRLLATTTTQAKQLVDKIEHYIKNGSSLYAGSNAVNCNEEGYSSTQGDWRLRYSIIADDRDKTIDTFVPTDAEPAYAHIKANYPEMNGNKIYLDAYQQVTTVGGQRYPEAKEEINRNIRSGNILMSYVGHGGELGASSERVITIDQINSWSNIDNMPLFVSATCEFTRFDDAGRVSAGEYMSLNPKGGAIALMTTTRSVYFNVNTNTNRRLFENVFNRDSDGNPLAFGEIFRLTKNAVSASENKRSFTLIGDPALKIALPTEKIVLDSLNKQDITLYTDTLKALSSASMAGHIEDQYGNKLSNYNGIIQPTIYDKPKTFLTLGQDLGIVREFELQKNILFKGNNTVKNGEFNFEFIVPKDINYNFGKGKVSMYAWNEMNLNAGDYDTSIIIGGIDTSGFTDNIGPTIDLVLNDENFVSGGITDQTPILKVKLFDESGINTVGNGIGHDITAVIDEETSKPIFLNAYYEADLDTYKSGKLNFQLAQLEPGKHTLKLKAWDVNNNSSEVNIDFVVQEDVNLSLDHLLNYPNPFTTSTKFFFEHNQACNELNTQIEIYTVTGRVVKTINTTVKTQGFRSEGIEWDGKDEYGDQLAKGVYVYRITVELEDGKKSSAIEKLYLLK